MNDVSLAFPQPNCSGIHGSQRQILHPLHWWLSPEVLPCAPAHPPGPLGPAVVRLCCLEGREGFSSWQVEGGFPSFLLAQVGRHVQEPAQNTPFSSLVAQPTTIPAEAPAARLTGHLPTEISHCWQTQRKAASPTAHQEQL